MMKYKEYSETDNLSSGDEVKCVQSLYKSTYGKNAFNNNKKYKIDSIENSRVGVLVRVIDETGRPFTFIKEKNRRDMYYFGDYFKILNNN